MNVYLMNLTCRALRYTSACVLILAVLSWTAGQDLAADDLEPVYTFATKRGGYVEDGRSSAGGKKVFTIGNKPAIGVWDKKPARQ